LAQAVENDGGEQNSTSHDVLVESGNIEQIEGVLGRTHDQHADDDSGYRGNTARQGYAPQYAGRDHRKLQTLTRVWLARGDSRSQDDSRNCGDEPL
jgi:hypothetical protein